LTRVKGKGLLLWAPLLAFVAFFALVAVGLLKPADTAVRSKLIGKALPALTLPPIVPGHPGLTGHEPGPRLVNIFASWCVPCAAEVEELARLRAHGVVVDGIAVRDTPAELSAFLARHGNPYRAIGSDAESRSMLALGSSGVPETFVVDAAGVIRYQHIGAIGPQDFDGILQAVQDARTI
jgi:cytochrome c biogenesis protein CcmG/thiol:disulfide interchange protein DsbE